MADARVPAADFLAKLCPVSHDILLTSAQLSERLIEGTGLAAPLETSKPFKLSSRWFITARAATNLGLPDANRNYSWAFHLLQQPVWKDEPVGFFHPNYVSALREDKLHSV